MHTRSRPTGNRGGVNDGPLVKAKAAAAAAAAGEEDEDTAEAMRAAEAAVEVAQANADAISAGKQKRAVQTRITEVYEVHFSLDGGRTRTLLGDVQPYARIDGAIQIPLNIPGVTGRVNLQKRRARVGEEWISSFGTAPRKGEVRLYAKLAKRASTIGDAPDAPH
jgi:hypothetical protein